MSLSSVVIMNQRNHFRTSFPLSHPPLLTWIILDKGKLCRCILSFYHLLITSMRQAKFQKGNRNHQRKTSDLRYSSTALFFSKCTQPYHMPHLIGPRCFTSGFWFLVLAKQARIWRMIKRCNSESRGWQGLKQNEHPGLPYVGQVSCYLISIFLLTKFYFEEISAEV